jgi:arabinogalactan oligomer/maltooligosaccharide transport system substrate-binding protein
MKKVLLLAVTLLAVLTLAACGGDREVTEEVKEYDNCETPDGNNPCWNKEAEMFRWEDGAVIEIGVDNDTLGAALVEKWNADYPELADKLVFVNYGSANGATSGVEGLETGQADAPDVALVIDNEVTGRITHVADLHEYFADLGAEQTHNVVYETINQLGAVYLPAFYDGMSFSWNKTMLEEWGWDLTDANNDGLPEAFDTWEEIFAIADAWTERPTFNGNDILEVFPISLDEPWSGYSSTTAGGWQLFGDGTDLSEPGFGDAEFLAGLEFIKEFSMHAMSVDETGTKKAADAMGWRWDAYLDGAYPFALVGTWMDVDGKEAANSLDFKFSPMPTFAGQQLSPLMKTKGFVINAYTEYPSASAEVLRWLYTQDTFETIMDSSSYLPALEADAAIYPVIDSENKAEFALGMALNHLEVAGSLPNNPTNRAMNVYYSIGINGYYKNVWDGVLTPAAAQTEIEGLADAWMTENNVTPE